MLKLALLWGKLGMLEEPKAGGNHKGNYEEEAPGDKEPSRGPLAAQSTEPLAQVRTP